ncbi:MAG: response regulator transcription factor [Treponema sp.]|nr:response regulator transcription factor [Treponema sp.]
MIKILIVEDQTMLRNSLEYLINGQNDMEVVGTVDDAAKAPGLCRELQPDLVLMDVVTKNNTTGIHASGIHFTADIRKEFPDIKIVIMTGLPEITFVEEARRAGAHSFVYKEMDNEHLFHVIRTTMKGYSIYSGSSDHMPFAASFTEKEIAVIRLVCKGMARDEIAKKMNVSESMIKQYITSILDKTGFDSISKFAIYAVGQGLVAPDIH